MAKQIPPKLAINTSYALSSGHRIPILGYGVYQTPTTTAESVVSHALRTGYRHIDSARAYRNEAPCADAIRASGLKREDVVFTTKIPPKARGYEAAKAAVDDSLRDTGLEYIDLYLIHAPYGGKEGRLGAWKALVEAQKAGKVRSIGVSNYGVHHLNELEEYISTSQSEVGGSKIDIGQWELHPWLPHEDIVEWARKRDIVIQAWSPLVRSTRSDEPILKKIGEKHGKTWAQVLLRWSLQQGFVPLPKSVTEALAC